MARSSRLEDNIPALRRYAWALLRNDSEADDLVQDCLLRALVRAGRWSGEGDMRAWLFTIMHNLFVSRWRRRKRIVMILSDVEADRAIPPPQPASADLRDALRALDQLPEDQRQVLLLVAVEGLDYAAVATVLGIPVGTVMSRLSRARDRLRELTEGRERPLLRRVK